MQIENIKISPAEVNNFPTALKWRRHKPQKGGKQNADRKH
uniref:Uncharacterized protein n=1 Tax=Siphoviridae sp. ctEP635 TaxID=2825396 RepID=A0A8S5UWV9_9CAUD|nr:MAG TPA: hypothetical protein [Siphoviridae sp. ctEP635]